MSARRGCTQTTAPRGAWLAFLAVALQVLLPFFLAAQIARAEAPGGVAVICSALGHDSQHSKGNPADQGPIDQCCSICSTLAAAQGVAPPATPRLLLPTEVSRVYLSAADVTRAALLVTSSYQSRGPPSIA